MANPLYKPTENTVVTDGQTDCVEIECLKSFNCIRQINHMITNEHLPCPSLAEEKITL